MQFVPPPSSLILVTTPVPPYRTREVSYVKEDTSLRLLPLSTPTSHPSPSSTSRNIWYTSSDPKLRSIYLCNLRTFLTQVKNKNYLVTYICHPTRTTPFTAVVISVYWLILHPFFLPWIWSDLRHCYLLSTTKVLYKSFNLPVLTLRTTDPLPPTLPPSPSPTPTTGLQNNLSTHHGKALSLVSSSSSELPSLYYWDQNLNHLDSVHTLYVRHPSL